MKVSPDRVKPLPTVKMVEKVLGMEASKWKDKCHQIACAMLDAGLVAGVERYGHYYGPVSPGYSRRALPFQRHGWIETPDGQVIDPTRWVFEMVEPYIYHGPGDDYDAAKQRMRAEQVGPYPGPHDPASESKNLTASQREAQRKTVQLNMNSQARTHLGELTGGHVASFSVNQVYWLAHLPLAWLGEHAPAIYGAIAKAGYKAMIPFDAWRMVMEKPMASHYA